MVEPRIVSSFVWLSVFRVWFVRGFCVFVAPLCKLRVCPIRICTPQSVILDATERVLCRSNCPKNTTNSDRTSHSMNSRVIASHKPVGCVAQTQVFNIHRSPVTSRKFIGSIANTSCSSRVSHIYRVHLLFIAQISCPPHTWGHFSCMECETYLLQLRHRSATYFIHPNPGTRQPRHPGCCPRRPRNCVQGRTRVIRAEPGCEYEQFLARTHARTICVLRK